MPIALTNAYASSASLPKRIGSSTPAKSTARKPAARSMAADASGSASPNIPGAPTGGAGRSRPAASAPRISRSHSLCVRSRQATIVSWAPERNPRPMLVNAASGSPKNIAPKRLIAAEYSPVANGNTCASPCSNETLRETFRPAQLPSRDRASARRDRRRPRSPTTRSRATARVDCPQPQPMSSTRSSGVIPRRVDQAHEVRAGRGVVVIVVGGPMLTVAAVPGLRLLDVRDLRARHASSPSTERVPGNRPRAS